MKYVFAFFVVGLVMGCFSEGDCLITATNQLHIQLKKRSNTAKDTLMTFNSISISGGGTSAVSAPISEFLLPLNIKSDSTLLVFSRANASSPDSILLGYTRQSKIITKDCGAYTYFQNLKILKTNLDSTQFKVFHTILLKDPTSSAITAYALNYQILY
jgi:hypothetical protein